MNRTMNGKRMSLQQVRVREALIKQNMRDNFSISDEEWDKINNEKISNRSKYVMAGTGSKKGGTPRFPTDRIGYYRYPTALAHGTLFRPGHGLTPEM